MRETTIRTTARAGTGRGLAPRAGTAERAKTPRGSTPRGRSEPSPGAIGQPPPAAVGPTDPRWLFAARVAGAIEGGRAGILRPERRERLLRSARLLGLRPFDAALVIAMVQDTARRGETLDHLPPLTPALAERLTAVPEAGRRPAPRAEVHILQRLAGALIIAGSMVGAAILWLNGAS